MIRQQIKTAIALSILSIAFFAIQSSAQSEAPVIGFQGWKNARVEEAKSALERIQTSSDRSPSQGAKPAEARERRNDSVTPPSRLQSLQKNPRADQRLQQAQLNLEIAQELSVNDYFVLYLSQFKNRESFVEAAKRLTPEEAAELMMAYQRSLRSHEQRDPQGPSAGLLPESLRR